jgi:TPR repeat protein
MNAKPDNLLAAPRAETDFQTQMLIRDGNKLMREGDINAARRLYEQAAADGSAETALALGRSYDPSYFEKLHIKTGKPDAEMAFHWYEKAHNGGLITARVKIDGLKQWMQR